MAADLGSFRSATGTQPAQRPSLSRSTLPIEPVNDIFDLQSIPSIFASFNFPPSHLHNHATTTTTLTTTTTTTTKHTLIEPPETQRRTSTMSRLLRLRPLHSITHRAPAAAAAAARLSSSFSRGPAPPRLPADQQAEFERLQRQASVSSAFQHLVQDDASSSSSSAAAAVDSSSSHSSTQTPSSDPLASAQVNAVVADSQAAPPSPATATPTPTVAATDEDTMHPNYVRGAPPEFEGDVNPRTGEVGGPKREPLRWGAAGDWSYNGRVTDF
ncbi:DUF1674-domain-containing protein [Colletotrichum somersetense]|nr:DUF1674-domain-containing protein [Colletotrichum somersetense]